MDDIFCRIIKGEIDTKKVYEDDDVLAILDTAPKSPGHTLVMPKAHYVSFLDTPKEIMHKVTDVAQRVAQAMGAVFNASGVRIIMNCGPAAGQEVPHFHVHVIPYYEEGSELIEMKQKELLLLSTKVKETAE